jgi:hypothetical protein
MPVPDLELLRSFISVVDHLTLTAKNGFPAIPDTELALVLAPDASGATRR